MNALMDQAERNKFILEQEKNISVIAPAGVGKTRSIVERIVNLARQPEAVAVDRLPRLVVVTYSVRAAQQMQQKARVAIRNAAVSSRVQRAFQQTFFGTIHSYCVRLLDRFGHYLGLPSSVALLEADDEVWNRFLIHGLGPGISANTNLRDLFHFYAPEKLYSLGKEISPGDEIEIGPLPELTWRRLLDYRGEGLHAATKKSIVRAQDSVRQWSEAWVRGDRFRPLPKCPTSEKAAAFAEIWDETFAPWQAWLREAARAFGRQVANAYGRFRLAEATMTYDDQVRMAWHVLKLPAVQQEMAEERLSVLLDEAQDTDRRQFEVLQRVAGLHGIADQASDQSFCMVGDFQQAIYAPRSDLAMYKKVDEEISAGSRGMRVRLQVTFRCDRAVIAFVNRIFPAVLDGLEGQCDFVPLEPRADAGPGQVVRWRCPDEPAQQAGEKITAEIRARHEARFVAQRIRELGPAGLGASEWSQVAVLCPRKNWLLDMQRELVALGLPVQLHSSNEQQRERTPGAWLTALIWVAAHPEESFEIAGVLREIFGVSDHDMATYTAGKGDRLRLDQLTLENEGGGPVEAALQILREACAGAGEVALHQAVETILEKTRLRERLNSIPELALENVDRELDDFLAMIAGRSAAGATLAELAEELRTGLTQAHPAEEEIRDAIQLLTSHKSKGLEWEAVIAPYFFRTIESKPMSYPRLALLEGGREVVCRDKADYAAQAQVIVEARERQQLQRLLYVTCTRAKRTLLLIDDETLYAGQKRRSGWSAGELLKWGGEVNGAAWRELPETPALSAPAPAPKPALDPLAPPLPDLAKEDVRLAVAHALTFPRRVTPHALAKHVPRDAEPEKQAELEDEAAAGENPGILYGTWWHEFVQTVPWQQPDSTWQRRFTEAQAHSPQPERSKREWELFRASRLAKWLAEPGRLIQAEFPFLWRGPDGLCREGIMDLAVFSPADSTWHVIDWKTNRIEPEGSKGLVEVYRRQIEAYVLVLQKILATEVKGSLYLTQTGEWVDVD